MTDKKFNELKKKVEGMVLYWKDVLGLQSYRLRFKYIREYHATKETVAQAIPLWQYKTATLEFFMPSMLECDDIELEEDILHELVHVLMAPTTGNNPSNNEHERATHEYAVQSVTYALLWAKEAGAQSAKV